jgi:hypothetical protein
VQAPGRANTRLAAGAGTVALAVALALAPLAATRAPRAPLAWLGAIAVLLAAAAAWRIVPLAGVAVAILAAEYGLSLYHQPGPVDTRAPLFAAGLLLLVELAYWSAGESHRLMRDRRDVIGFRLAVLAVLALAAVTLGALVLLAAELPLAGPVARLTLGVAAASTVLALIALLSRRGRERS